MIPQMGYTLEHIILSGQNVNGIYNHNFPLWIRDINSTNAVPAVVNAGIGRLTLVDGQLSGGAPKVSAIQDNSNDGGVLFLRNIVTAGYQSALSRNGAATGGTSIAEYVSKGAQSLFSSVAASLNLPVKETPTYVNPDFTQRENVRRDWQRLDRRYSGHSGGAELGQTGSLFSICNIRGERHAAHSIFRAFGGGNGVVSGWHHPHRDDASGDEIFLRGD